MSLGFDSPEVQQHVAQWRAWLEHFSSYTDEAARGLGQMYSEDPRFAAHFEKYATGFAAFLSRAITHYMQGISAGKRAGDMPAAHRNTGRGDR